jgi:hypothetical protein
LGVWKKPEAGGYIRPGGGQFVFISGRPYRYYWEQLSANIDVILTDFFQEDEVSGSDLHSLPPLDFKLEPAYPNPFNSETTIEFICPARSRVTIDVINLLGQNIRTLVDREVSAGRHTVVWDGRDIQGRDEPSGVYFLVMKTNQSVFKIKCILLR